MTSDSWQHRQRCGICMVSGIADLRCSPSTTIGVSYEGRAMAIAAMLEGTNGKGCDVFKV